MFVEPYSEGIAMLNTQWSMLTLISNLEYLNRAWIN